MQTLTSQYGRDPLEVADEIPTAALRYILGSVHIATPDSEIEEFVRERTERNGYTDDQTAQTLAAALWLHKENGAEYRWVMGGMPRISGD